MKNIILVVALLCLLVSPSLAVEQLNLSPQVICSTYRVERLYLDWPGQLINISLLCVETGEVKIFTYTGEVARTLMIALNKANLSTSSLQKRILEKLVADGKLGGTVTGTPD